MNQFKLIEALFRYAKLGDNSLNYHISRIVLANINTIENFSIKELAQKAFCSKASVVRFCKLFNLEGYKELSKTLATQYKNLKDSINQDPGEDLELLKNAANNINENLASIENFNFFNIISVARYIKKADIVYFVNDESEIYLQKIFADRMKEYNIEHYFISSFDDKSFLRSTEKSVIIFLSFFEPSSKTLEIFLKSSTLKITTVVITNTMYSPIYHPKNINIVSLLNSTEHIGANNHQVVSMYILAQIFNLIDKK